MVGGFPPMRWETQKPLFTSLRAPFHISLPCNCWAMRRLQRRLFFRDAILRLAIAACRGRQGPYAASGQVLLVAHVLSAVTKTSKPAASAASSKSPLLRVSYPRSLAFVTV